MANYLTFYEISSLLAIFEPICVTLRKISKDKYLYFKILFFVLFWKYVIYCKKISFYLLHGLHYRAQKKLRLQTLGHTVDIHHTRFTAHCRVYRAEYSQLTLHNRLAHHLQINLVIIFFSIKLCLGQIIKMVI